jgi:hypothetical protein
VTPTAVKASRMDLLLTSSSRARSLMRTLLIYSFSRPRSSGFESRGMRWSVAPSCRFHCRFRGPCRIHRA